MTHKQAGFSLVELVVFIVVIGIVISGVFTAFSTALQKSPIVNPQTTAIELANARMDIIIDQRHMVGFASFADPCTEGSPPAICTLGISGYTTTSTISAYTIGSDANYKIIDVLVTGPQNARANMKTFVAAY